METRANPIIVGLFTLIALVSAFAFIYWLGRYGDRGDLVTYRVVFTDDVSGLLEGSPVLFNGLKVGQVRELGLSADDNTQVVARIEISADTPINIDTTARLQPQGVTGGSVLMLRAGRHGAPSLIEAWGDKKTSPIIFAESSGMQNLLDGAQKLISRIDTVANRLDQLIANNETAVSRTIQNVESFSQVLADRSEAVGKLLDDVSLAARNIASLSQKLEPAASKLDGILAAVEPDDVGKTIANLRTFSDSVAAKTEQFDNFMDSASSAATRLNDIAGSLGGVGDDVAALIKSIDGAALQRSIANVENFTETLSGKSQTVDQFIEDAGAIAKQFRGTSQRIDALVARVDGMLGEDGSGFMQNLNETAKSFRTLADKLNSKLDVIGNDIQRFSGRGLRDVEAFVSDGRRTLNGLNRVLREFERNPARFLTQGGSNVPEYRANRR